MKFLALLYFLFSISAYAHQDHFEHLNGEDFEAMSTSSENLAEKTCNDIKKLFGEARSHSTTVKDILLKIKTEPDRYNISKIKKEWDAELEDLRNSLFCGTCGRTRNQLIRDGVTDTEAHYNSNGRRKATQADYDRVNNIYSPKLDDAIKLSEKLDTSKSERERLIWKALNLKESYLYPSYTKAYNYQLQAFLTEKEQVKGVLKLKSEVIVLTNELFVSSEEGSDDYYEYFQELVSTVSDMRSDIDRLNEKRKQKNSSAKLKLDKFMAMENSMKSIARDLGDELEFATKGSWVASSFLFPQATLYQPFNANEVLENFVTPEVIKIIKKTESF